MFRRAFLLAASWVGLGLAGGVLAARPGLASPNDSRAADDEAVKRLLGRAAVDSPLVHLRMPPVFANGYSVPMTLTVDSVMTEADHVRIVHVIAPRNPIILAARFGFTPQSGRAAVSTRIRLSEPQTVLAIAEMSDGTLLMARNYVKVDTNGCA